MPSINKKGLAQVITVILIITLTISAAGIFFAAITNPISSLSPTLDCTTKAIQSSIDIKDACYNLETEEIEVQITKKLDNIEINQILFTASNGNQRESWGCGTAYSCSFCKTLSSGQTKTYFLNDVQLSDHNSILVTVDGCNLKSQPIRPC